MSSWLDSDGYPTEECLRRLEVAGSTEAFAILREAFQRWGAATDTLRPEEAAVVGRSSKGFLRLATGGWSGNEDMVAAFERNIVHAMTWRLSARGGLEIYEIPGFEIPERNTERRAAQ